MLKEIVIQENGRELPCEEVLAVMKSLACLIDRELSEDLNGKLIAVLTDLEMDKIECHLQTSDMTVHFYDA